MFGGSAVRGWSSNQSVIALSSGEAEYYAALKGASAALGFQAMLADLGIPAKIILYTDSSAARGIIHRAGLGKLRHLETGYLWLQAAVKAKRLQVRKVFGHGESSRPFHKAFSSRGYVAAPRDIADLDGRWQDGSSPCYMMIQAGVPGPASSSHCVSLSTLLLYETW